MPITLYLSQKNWVEDITIPKNKVMAKKLQILHFFLPKKVAQPIE